MSGPWGILVTIPDRSYKSVVARMKLTMEDRIRDKKPDAKVTFEQEHFEDNSEELTGCGKYWCRPHPHYHIFGMSD